MWLGFKGLYNFDFRCLYGLGFNGLFDLDLMGLRELEGRFLPRSIVTLVRAIIWNDAKFVVSTV